MLTRERKNAPSPEEAPEQATAAARDIMAAARMIASENPSAPEDAKAEQIHAKLRAKRPGQNLYDFLTAGKDWGPQDGTRPASTAKPATPADIALAKEVLSGQRPSKLPGARKFFDPDEQNRVYAQVQKGREDLAAGKEIHKRTAELIAVGYSKTAEDVRAKWTREGTRFVGSIGPVEFWT